MEEPVSVLPEEPTLEQISAVIPAPVKTQSTTPLLNQFQKNVVFVSVAVLVVVLISIGANYAVQEHARDVAEQARTMAAQAQEQARTAEAQTQEYERRLAEMKAEWRRFNVRQLRDMIVVRTLTTEEQTRIDNAGDDVDRLQQVLVDIHKAYMVRWEDVQRRSLDDARFKESEREVINNNVLGFRMAWQKIHDWKPVSFEDYLATTVIQP